MNKIRNKTDYKTGRKITCLLCIVYMRGNKKADEEWSTTSKSVLAYICTHFLD